MSDRFVTFPCEDITLEGVLHDVSAAAPHPGVVVCHPHPLYGGDMDNHVVTTVCQALARTGIASLRFNFRGVGRSGGHHSEGIAEQKDVRAALDFLLTQPGINAERIGLIGYSFGALVAAGTASADQQVKALDLISPPIRGLDGKGLAEFLGARLIVTGDADQFAPLPELHRIVADLAQPTELAIIAGADHFWMGHLAELAQHVPDFFARWLLQLPQR